MYLRSTHAHGSGTVDDPHDSWLGIARDADAEAGPVALLHHQALGLLQNLGLHAWLLLVHLGFVGTVARERIVLLEVFLILRSYSTTISAYSKV